MKALITTILACLSLLVGAQEVVFDNFGDEKQPGHRLHDEIAQKIENGTMVAAAIETTILQALEQTATVVNAESKSVLAFDLSHSNLFFDEMVKANSLIEVTKVLTEMHPSKAVHTIQMGVSLYPDFVQEVYDGASLAGVMSPDDILVAAIQSGADPSDIGDSTAAGPATDPNLDIPPLGPGIGGGGAGGGDPVASTN